MTVYFTSDTHWGHKGVLRHMQRPWTDLDAMTEGLIANWNSTIKSMSDDVYHLGDFSFYRPAITEAILKRLNGRIHLIKGNHDYAMPAWLREKFVWVKDLAEIEIENQKVVLCHYPMLTWNKAHYGVWHLHGHCHGSLSDQYGGRRLDVGIDCHPEFRPFSWAEVTEKMAAATFVKVDHHEARTRTSVDVDDKGDMP